MWMSGESAMNSTRRDFLKATLGASAVLSLGGAVPEWLVRSARAASTGGDRDTVLVVVQLTGGNDGLNTVVPFEDDAYARSRPTLRLPPAKVHRIDTHLGFHPRMAACARLFQEGKLAVVQGVGYPRSSRSHEPAMRVWQTADPARPERPAGWLGRMADRIQEARAVSLPVVFVGATARPLAVNAEDGFVPSIRAAEDLVLVAPPGAAARRREPGRSRRAADGPLLDHLRRTAAEARVASERIARVLAAGRNARPYPDLGLAARLRTVARLVRADLGIRVFFTELGGDGFGGFDNHANQLGNHCALLHQLSESVGAFVADLEADGLLDRVLLMTFSEFGRTVAENGRRGTGHGAAAPLILAGGGLKGGLHGSHPSLTDLDEGACRFHTDFRRVYATVIDRWLGLDPTVVPGGPFPPAEILKA